SGDKTGAQDRALRWPCPIARSLPVDVSKNRIEFRSAMARLAPSGENWHSQTPIQGIASVQRFLPVRVSHRASVSSEMLRAASTLPSEEKANGKSQKTDGSSGTPGQRTRGLPLWLSGQSRAVALRSTVARNLPQGANIARESTAVCGSACITLPVRA